MNHNNARRDVEWTWSGIFWLKKLILLGLIFLTAWLIWWLWQGFDDDSLDLESSVPSVGNPVDTVVDAVDGDEEGEAEEDEDGELATPSPTPVATPEATFGYTIARLERDGQVIEPVIDGCLHSYELKDGVVVTVADNCDDLRGESNDFSWEHRSNAARTTITSANASYCAIGSEGCSAGNGVLEFSSLSEDVEAGFVDVRIVSTDNSDEAENAQATYGDIISSIKVER